MTVAQTILDQLGGNKFIAMTGSKNFLSGEKYLSMKLAKNQSGATQLRIELEATDTYKMEFLRCTKKGCSTIIICDFVYCDELQSWFTAVTGLNTSL